MKLSVSHPSHSPWKSPKSGDFTHSHRTTTTTHYDDNLALQKRRRFSFAPTEDVSAKLKCPVRAKLKCPNYPSEDEVREAEIEFGDDERTRTATHRRSF